MPRSIDLNEPDPLNPFYVWLMQCGKRQATALSYTGLVRSALRHMGLGVGIAPPDMAWFDQLLETRPKSYYNVRSAWRAYAEWMAKTQGVAMPLPTGGRGGSHQRDPNATAAAPLPESVRDAVRDLVKAGLSFSMIHTAQWVDVLWDTVRPGLDGVTTVLLRNPINPTLQVRIPFAPLIVLAEYAQAGHVFVTPIIPLSPGSELHYPLERLRREAGTHKATPLEIAQKMREKAAAVGPPGSALGSQRPAPLPPAAQGHTVLDILSMLGDPESAKQVVASPECVEDEDELELIDEADVDSDGPPDEIANGDFETAARALGISPRELKMRLGIE